MQKITIFFFIGMMSFLASSIIIRDHIQSENDYVSLKKSAKTNPLNNLVEEEIHHNEFEFIQNNILKEITQKRYSIETASSYQDLFQEVIVPPPEFC